MAEIGDLCNRNTDQSSQLNLYIYITAINNLDIEVCSV